MGSKKVCQEGRKKKKGKFKVAFTNRKASKILSESGNNELSKDELAVLREDEKLSLSSWGLPPSILAKYKSKGLTSLFQWQLDCLSNERVLEGYNLLYSAPTSAGKTLVAEILMIKRVLELGKKAIMILPFVSVAREKMYSLQELFGDAGVRVEGFMGSYNPPGGFKAVDIAICTIEKANSLINRLLEEGALNQLGTVVVDEIHLLGDPHRGYLLELLLTKIRYMSKKSLERVPSSDPCNAEADEKPKKLSIQIVGMSATLPNLNVLANWLDAELVVTDFRPVPLVQRIKIDEDIYDEEMHLVRPVLRSSLPITIPSDKDHVVYLSLETILDGHSILIFCPSKKMCEQTAEHIAREFYNIGNPGAFSNHEVGQRLRDQLNSGKIADVMAQLTQCPAGMDEILGKTVAFGVAFHHAGLTYDERDIVEASFKSGVLRVIVATSTLSAGVNLPARRVIIRTPNFNGGILDVLTYKQMSGRAGRKGIDDAGKKCLNNIPNDIFGYGYFGGESLLICSKATQTVGIKLIQSYLPHVKSALLGHNGCLTSAMKRAMLEVVASGVAQSPAEVHAYSKCTLLSCTTTEPKSSEEDSLSPEYEDVDVIDECLKFLKDNEFIRLRKYENAEKCPEYIPTQLGSACLASSLSPDEGIAVFKELQKARQCFVLENELHVVYQVTPIYLADQWRNIDWHNYLMVWESLTLDERKVADLVGVEESFITRAMMGTVSRRNPKQAANLSIHQRFFTALALNDLVNEKPIGEVAQKYYVNKGVIQNLQQAASTFAGMVTVFCNRLGWFNLELLLSQFQERLQFGIQRELCDLVRLSLVNGQRARIIYDAGVKTIAELAASDPSQIEQFLHKAGSFTSTVHGDAVSKPLWVVGKSEGLSEVDAAFLIVQEARQFLQIDLDLPETLNYSLRNSFVLSPNKTSKVNLSINHNKVLDVFDSSESDSDVSEKEGLAHENTPRTSSRLSNIDCQLPLPKDPEENAGTEQTNGPNQMVDNKHNESKSGETDVFEESFPLELMDSQTMKEFMTENMESGFNTENYRDMSIEQKHSTPLQNSGGSRDANAFMSFYLEKDKDEMAINESFGDIMMDSLTSQMDVSLQISVQNDPVIPVKDSTMSEELFPECKVNEIIPTVEENDLFDSPDIFNGSFAVGHNGEKSKDSSASSSDVESDEFDLNFIKRKVQTNSYKDVQLYGQNIRIKTVESPEFIPIETFRMDQLVGVGINLATPKRTRSLSRTGIGSKIVTSRGFSHSVQRPNSTSIFDNEVKNGIAIYNCADGIIWLYQWKHEEADRQNLKSRISQLLRRMKCSRAKIVILDAKDVVKKIQKFCGKSFTMLCINSTDGTSILLDPKIAEWLIEPDEHSPSLGEMISKYLIEECHSLEKMKWPIEAQESYLSWAFIKTFKKKLEALNLWSHFTDVEMPSINPLILMEKNGFGVNAVELENLKKYLDFKSALLELKAYQLAGRQFNLSSPKEIRQILFHEIGLKEPHVVGTSKDILVKLDHELPHLIIEWRKVANAIQMVKQFLQDRDLNTGRVHGVYSHFTISGRVIMSEPSLQCIPRDFDLKIFCDVEEIKNIRDTCRIRFGSKIETLLKKIEHGVNFFKDYEDSMLVKMNISMRNSFVPCSSEFLLMSADYSQLELRILAHLCGDENLLRVLNQATADVFRSVAAQWKAIDCSQVTNEMRQEAKAVTYGIIYGMGSKALSEQMNTSEEEASQFISDFMRAYPRIRGFIDSTIAHCREKGYVETIGGRRRKLENIKSKNSSERAQAERQAINFRIQGSASDLVKMAMNHISSNLGSLFPETINPMEWKRHPSGTKPNLPNNICFPILNLHDELIFEVKETHLSEIGDLVKSSMETCLKLDVLLPVVVKTGKTWGTLSPFFA